LPFAALCNPACILVRRGVPVLNATVRGRGHGFHQNSELIIAVAEIGVAARPRPSFQASFHVAGTGILILFTCSQNTTELRRASLGREELIFMNARVGILLILLTGSLSARQRSPQSQIESGNIYLDVVVTSKSGPPVNGLQQQDFTLVDNKLPQAITSFRALSGSDARVEVILVLDAVNIDYERVAFVREQIDKFLRADGGHLEQPTALAFFTDKGMQIEEGFSSDGNALSTVPDRYAVALRTIRRSSEYEGAERFNLSIEALRELSARETSGPGRKIVLWISPGWPLLSGPATAAQIDSKQQQQLFANVVSLSAQLQQARITLYSIDPLGAGESMLRANYYQQFLKGVTESSKVEPANLSLQVLATQSGGLALDFNNDVTVLLRECLADTQAYYEISFDPPAADHRDEYHHLEIRVAKPGVTGRTRQGYYAQPAH
jgi:VWFA-related protein